jgi:2-oxoglutarate ferredoxin oxidoreductase subunit gamma
MDSGTMPATRYELRFSGAGGQGIITAAIIFAEAAGVHGGKHVSQTQSYGPEARGGKSKAEIVISDQPIDFPMALSLDLLLAMTQEACDAYFYDLKPNGLLVVDSSLVEQYPTSRVVALPFTGLARNKTGETMTANMVALGAIGVLTRQVSLEHLEKALLSRVPPDTQKKNKMAFEIGIEKGKMITIDQLPHAILDEADDL